MSKHHRSSNQDLGSYLYRLIYLVILYLGLKLFGLNFFNDIILFVVAIVSFELVGYILRKMGVWKY